jgi:broad specificity phosphatase PhoE
MLTKDIRQKQPGWDIWRDGYVFLVSSPKIPGTSSLSNLFCLRLVLMDRCPDGETPGESPQEMSDRVDRTIAKIRKTHQEVNILLFDLSLVNTILTGRPRTLHPVRRTQNHVTT